MTGLSPRLGFSHYWSLGTVALETVVDARRFNYRDTRTELQQAHADVQDRCSTRSLMLGSLLGLVVDHRCSTQLWMLGSLFGLDLELVLDCTPVNSAKPVLTALHPSLLFSYYSINFTIDNNF